MLVKRSVLVLLVVVVAVTLTACGGGASGGDTGATGSGGGSDDELVVGFVPSVEAGNLTERAQPLADILTEELDRPVKVQVFTNYIGLVEAMGNEQADVGFLNSFGYVLAHERYPEVSPMFKSVRYGSPTYRGQFMVQSGSGIENLQQLEGKSMAFVDPASTSGYLFPAYTLVEEGLVEKGADPKSYFGETTFAGSHDNAAIALYNGEVDAAVGYEDIRATIEEDYPDVMEKLKVIGYTDKIPNDTISSGPTVSEQERGQLQDAFMAAVESEEGKKVFEDIYEIDGLEPAKDSEYDVVRKAADALNIDIEQQMQEE